MPGIVAKPETINYRSFAPEKGGLFCEALFGPVADKAMRSTRFARLDLAVPVLHPWLFDATATLLALEPKLLTRILYGERSFDVDEQPRRPSAPVPSRSAPRSRPSISTSWQRATTNAASSRPHVASQSAAARAAR